MKLRKRITIPSLICVILVLITLLLTDFIYVKTKEANQLSALTQRLAKISQKDYPRTQRLKQELKNKDSEVLIANKVADERKQKVIDLQVVNEIIWFYQSKGTLVKYPWITPCSVYNRLMEIRKWRHLSGMKDNETMDFEAFTMTWMMQETNLNPKLIGACNKNNTRDYGLMQLNEICLPFLKGERWDNPESSIKGWMRWVKSRTDIGWGILNPEKPFHWDYYDMITRIKAKYK